MKIIKPEDFPIEMTDENINILAEMLDSLPPSKEWKEISDLINYEERNIIRSRIRINREIKEKIRWNSLTGDEQTLEKKQIKESMNDTRTFRGNMLEQERHSIDLERIEREKKK